MPPRRRVPRSTASATSFREPSRRATRSRHSCNAMPRQRPPRRQARPRPRRHRAGSLPSSRRSICIFARPRMPTNCGCWRAPASMWPDSPPKRGGRRRPPTRSSVCWVLPPWTRRGALLRGAALKRALSGGAGLTPFPLPDRAVAPSADTLRAQRARARRAAGERAVGLNPRPDPTRSRRQRPARRCEGPAPDHHAHASRPARAGARQRLRGAGLPLRGLRSGRRSRSPAISRVHRAY